MEFRILGRAGLNVSVIGLGGHTFIQELGVAPKPSEEEMVRIVAAALDDGVNICDTTHPEERIALGRCLAELQRRDEVFISAWNFWPGDRRFGPITRPLLESALRDLRTDHMDIFFAHHPGGGQTFSDSVMAILQKAVADGLIRFLGIGMCDVAILESLPPDHPFSVATTSFNFHDQKARAMFEKADQMGLGVVSLQPFGRGRFLLQSAPPGMNLAHAYLRYVLDEPAVDCVMNAMRAVNHVHENLPAADRGPLTPTERSTLESLSGA